MTRHITIHDMHIHARTKQSRPSTPPFPPFVIHHHPRTPPPPASLPSIINHQPSKNYLHPPTRRNMVSLKMPLALLLNTTIRRRSSHLVNSFPLRLHPLPTHHESRMYMSSVSPTKPQESGREKRKKFIGLAKAVDRGQYHAYNPLSDGEFKARSGLPEKELFTVLGIESSCDDTGGEQHYFLP